MSERASGDGLSFKMITYDVILCCNARSQFRWCWHWTSATQAEETRFRTDRGERFSRVSFMIQIVHSIGSSCSDFTAIGTARSCYLNVSTSQSQNNHALQPNTETEKKQLVSSAHARAKNVHNKTSQREKSPCPSARWPNPICMQWSMSHAPLLTSRSPSCNSFPVVSHMRAPSKHNAHPLAVIVVACGFSRGCSSTFMLVFSSSSKSK